MVSVRVYSRVSGKPIKGARVMLAKGGFFTGTVSSKEYTDYNGQAHFRMDPGNGKVFVDGRTVFNGHLAGMITVYK